MYNIDRIFDTASELNKAGLAVITDQEKLVIQPKKLQAAVFDSHNDHRMAMSLALIGLKIPGIRIKNPQCVNKSFPQYWQMLKQIGAEIVFV